MTKKYTITVDKTCTQHGGHNFAYQYDNETIVRIEETCEGCSEVAAHEPSAEVQAARASRSHDRPYRPSR